MEIKKSIKNKDQTDDKIDSNEDFINSKDFQKIKEELNKGTNFIDYFLIIGVDPEIYTQEWLYSNDFKELNENFNEKKISPKIISYFPPYEKTKIGFDDSLIWHCFPNGFKLRKSKKQPKKRLFSFILDNSFYNLDYHQKYLTCLLCYENISQYKLLYEKHKNNSSENLEQNKETLNCTTSTENSSLGGTTNNSSDIYIPKCLLFISLHPFFSEFERILVSIYYYSLGKIIIEDETTNKNNKQNNSILARRLTITNDNLLYGNDSDIDIFKRRNTFILKNNSNLNNNNINEEKLIQFVCHIPIEKFIENLLIELPAPPRGDTKVIYNLMGEQRTIKQTKMNELPLIDINLKKILYEFNIVDIIDIYRYLFLETRILFFSKKIENLNIFIYGFLSLLYPFEYQYQVVTILPKDNYEILESITPFIGGINQKYNPNFFEEKELTLSDCILIVDIDEGEANLINNQENQKIPEFPSSHKKTLEKNLKSFFNKHPELSEKLKMKVVKGRDKFRNSVSFSSQKQLLKMSQKINNENNEEEYDDDELFNNFNIDYKFNKELNEIFYKFNASLLSNYNNFLNLDFYNSNIAPCLESLFKVDDFLKEISSDEKKFYSKFINETQIFGDYLFMRMVPKNSLEKIRVLLFEEYINSVNRKKNNKIKNILTKSKDYEFNNNHEIEKQRELTNNEISYYINHMKKFLDYGIIIRIDNNKIIFDYPIFPKLTTNIFFKQNMNNYITLTTLNDNINLINTDIILQSHLGGIAERQNDMKNYIDLCWVQMWAMTFWYCDQNEKRYRFKKLLEILRKITNHEMEIFNLLFETLSKYGEDYMVLTLYDLLLKWRLNPSYIVHNIVMKILDKSKTEGSNINTILKKANKNVDKIVYEKKNFRKRTFKSKYYQNIFTEDIMFFAFDTCVVCENENIINLETACQDFTKMNRELMWYECPGCGGSMLPKLTIQFGREINKIGKMKNNTCNYDSVVLFSPYYLKNNYNNSLSRDFGIKLDLEEFMFKYSNIFWDSIWYFKLNGLEWDFMLPYERNFDVRKYNNNIDITTSDLYQKKQEFKIQRMEQIYP